MEKGMRATGQQDAFDLGCDEAQNTPMQHSVIVQKLPIQVKKRKLVMGVSKLQDF